MGSFADYLENKVLDHVFGGPDYTRPATLYIGLSTTTITDAGGNITEPSGGSYARVAKTNDATNFPAASGGSKSNGTDIDFGTATGDWGTVTDFFIADASTGGNILGYGALAVANHVVNGNLVTFPAGDLDITMT
jgi:hypothetical protein